MRSKWDMIHDILKVVRIGNGDIRKTEIAVKAGMRWKSFCNHHDMLIQRNLIAMSREMDCYKITRKGIQVLKGIEKLNKMLK